MLCNNLQIGDVLRVKWTLSKVVEENIFIMCGVLIKSDSHSTSPAATSAPVEVESIVNEAVVKERIEKLAMLAAEKDRFIRLMFHEIRTPLHNLSNTFNGAVKMMKLPTSVADELTYQV